jgi:hypothetical protein
MSDQIRVNGNVLSWGSIVVKFDGDRYYGFTSVSYGDKRERVKAYGQGRHHAPRGRSRGKYSTDPVKIGGPPSSFEILRSALAKRSGNGTSYGDVEFEVLVQAVEDGTERPINVQLEECVVTAESANFEENPDPLKEEWELDTMRIRRNGKTLFDSVTGAL